MPKLLALSLILLATGLFLFMKKKSVQDEPAILRQWLFPILGAFLMVGLVSSFFALNHRETYFDIAKTALFLMGAFFSALLIVRTPAWQDKISRLAILSAIPALIIGSVQYIQRVVMYEQDFLPDGRVVEYAVTAVMGHKNIYSAYIALLLPFAAFGTYRFRGKWQLAAIIISFLILMMIILLKTRSAWLGLGVGLIVSSLALVVHGKSILLVPRWRKGILAALLLLIIALVPLMWTGRTAPEFSIPGRAYSIIDPQSPHNIHRLTAWRSSVEMIRDHPLMGVGPGNWRIAILYYFEGKNVRIEAVNWARPHNDFLWVFAEKGMVGFVLFVAIFVMGFHYLFRIIKGRHEQTETFEKIFALCLASGMAIYLTDSLFSFPYERIEIQGLLFVMLGASAAHHHKLSSRGGVRMNSRYLMAFTVLICSFGLLVGYQSIKMEVHINKAIQALKDENWAESLRRSRASSTQFKSLDNNGYPVEYIKGLAFAGMHDHESSYALYHEAKKQSPRNTWILYNLSLACIQLGKMDEAEKHLLEANRVVSGSSSVLSSLSNIYYSRGEYRKARAMLMMIDNWEQDSRIRNNIHILDRLLEKQEAKP